MEHMENKMMQQLGVINEIDKKDKPKINTNIYTISLIFSFKFGTNNANGHSIAK